MPNDWETSWPQFFAKHRLQAILEEDRRNNGADPQMDKLGKQCIDHVVPRLLGALETNGHSIKPVLVHGDLSVIQNTVLNAGGAGMLGRIVIPGNP